MGDKFNAITTYADVNTIIIQASQKENGINLNPEYQRDIVWSNEKQSAFINSIMRNIIPNAIIFNNNESELIQICMDGKQRITSLVRFKKNEIPYHINDCDDESIFYDSAL